MSSRIDEKHNLEQYFFTQETCSELARIAEEHEFPCFLCAPMPAMAYRGRAARILDIDDRFARLSGFMQWDLYKAIPLHEKYGVLIVDPPFTRIDLGRLYRAINVLCEKDASRKVMISYTVSRENDILSTFSPFKLRPTGFFPTYVTVGTPIQFYANFEVQKNVQSNASAANSAVV